MEIDAKSWLLEYAALRDHVAFEWTRSSLGLFEWCSVSGNQGVIWDAFGVSPSDLRAMHSCSLSDMSGAQLSVAGDALGSGLGHLMVDHDEHSWEIAGFSMVPLSGLDCAGLRFSGLVSGIKFLRIEALNGDGVLQFRSRAPLSLLTLENLEPVHRALFIDLYLVGCAQPTEAMNASSHEGRLMAAGKERNYIQHRFHANRGIQRMAPFLVERNLRHIAPIAGAERRARKTQISASQELPSESVDYDTLLKGRKSRRFGQGWADIRAVDLGLFLQRSGIIAPRSKPLNAVPRASGENLSGEVRVIVGPGVSLLPGLWLANLGGEALSHKRGLSENDVNLLASAALASKSRGISKILVQVYLDVDGLARHYAESPGLGYALALKQGGVYMHAMYMAASLMNIGVCALGSLPDVDDCSPNYIGVCDMMVVGKCD